MGTLAGESPLIVHNIALIGMRGAGKTSVARGLATALQRPHADSDEWIEQTTRQSIREIFATRGEAEFRRLEQLALAELLAVDDRIISVGGGAVLSPDNRALLSRRAFCIWLQAAPESLHQRISADDRSVTLRPALTALSPLDELRKISMERAPLYAAVAHHAERTDDADCDTIAARLVEVIRLRR